MLIFSVKCLILHLFLDPITAKRKSMNTSNHAQIKISRSTSTSSLIGLDKSTGHPTNCTNEVKVKDGRDGYQDISPVSAPDK